MSTRFQKARSVDQMAEDSVWAVGGGATRLPSHSLLHVAFRGRKCELFAKAVRDCGRSPHALATAQADLGSQFSLPHWIGEYKANQPSLGHGSGKREQVAAYKHGAPDINQKFCKPGGNIRKTRGSRVPHTFALFANVWVLHAPLHSRHPPVTFSPSTRYR